MSAEIALLREMKKDAFWLDAHLSLLLKEHNDEFIAVKNEQLIAHGGDLDAVLSELRKIGFDTSKVLIRFISKNKFVLGGQIVKIPLTITKDERLMLWACFHIKELRVGTSFVEFVIDSGSNSSFFAFGDSIKFAIPKRGKRDSIMPIGGTSLDLHKLPEFDLVLEDAAGEALRLKVEDFCAAFGNKKSQSAINQAKAIPSILGLDFLRKHKLRLFVDAYKKEAYLEKD